MEMTVEQKRAIAIAQAKKAQADQKSQQAMMRQEILDDMNDEIGAAESFFINMGRGITNVGRGIGLVDKEDPTTKQAIKSLRDKRPVSGFTGEIVGEALPFAVPGAAIGNVASLPARIGLSAGLGATEGGVLANAKDQNVVQGSLLGFSIGAGSEVLAPVIGRLGRKLVAKVTGKPAAGVLIDNAGKPTAELQKALDGAGMTFDDLTEDAKAFISKQATGAQPEQVSRAAQFVEEGIPSSRADITQALPDRAVEEKLMQSASDPIAEQFRQFKLTQSEAIKKRLADLSPNNPLPEETGELIKDALIGRKKLLRTRKNDLYRQAAEAAENVGGLPIFTDNIKSAIPDERTIRRLDRVSQGRANDVMETLAEYGIIDPTEQMTKAGIEPEVLDIRNYEDLRQALLQIERSDTSGATSVMVGPIREALDNEAFELSETLSAKGFGDDVIAPLREARNIVRQMKTEFSPQAVTGRLIDTKKDGVTNIIEASSVYNKLAAKSMPVENVRKVVASLKNSGEPGQQAIASMQTTTLMDLIDAGFSTHSRKIDGVSVFNPIAFKNRIKQIGPDKLQAIFSNNPQALSRINNIEKIATLVTPAADATPKGSAAVLMDLMNRLGVIGITSKIPGGGLLIEGMTGLSKNSGTRREVAGAINSTVDVQRISSMIDETFPGIAAAVGISATQQEQQED